MYQYYWGLIVSISCTSLQWVKCKFGGPGTQCSFGGPCHLFGGLNLTKNLIHLHWQDIMWHKPRNTIKLKYANDTKTAQMPAKFVESKNCGPDVSSGENFFKLAPQNCRWQFFRDQELSSSVFRPTLITAFRYCNVRFLHLHVHSYILTLHVRFWQWILSSMKKSTHSRNT